MIIVITGTPGTGKTHLARALKKQFPHQIEHLELNKILVRRKLTWAYDQKTQTYDVKPQVLKKCILAEIARFKTKITSSEQEAFEQRFEQILLRLQQKHSLSYQEFRTILKKDLWLRRLTRGKPTQRCILLIDSHLSHELPNTAINWCIITKTALRTLYSRLRARRYPPAKVRDNLQAEAFETSLMEAQEIGHRTICIST